MKQHAPSASCSHNRGTSDARSWWNASPSRSGCPERVEEITLVSSQHSPVCQSAGLTLVQHCTPDVGFATLSESGLAVVSEGPTTVILLTTCGLQWG